MVDAAADRYGVPRELAHAVAKMESNYNPRARSGVGAMGVMQLMPGTAQTLGVKNPWDAAQNIDGGVKYLAQLSDRFGGDPRLVMAAYNAGPGAVNKYGGVPPYRETQNYVAKGADLMASNASPAQTPQPATTGIADRSADPAQPDTNAGGNDLMSRIARGEKVQITPQDILQIAFGNSGADQAAPPKLAIAKYEPLAIAKYEPPAAPPPPQPPALERAWNAFTGSSGLQTLGGLSSAFPALAGRISGMPDYANEQRFKNTVSGLYSGIVGEPARISSELQKSGEALLKGDINAAADHIWFAIPYLGAVGAQMKEYLDRGDVAGALGHAAGALGTAAIATPEGRAAVAEAPSAVTDAVAEAAPKVGAAVKGAVQGAAEAATEKVPLRKFGINLSVYKPIVTGTAGGAAATAVGLPHPVGAIIGAAAPIIKGAIKGAREALAPEAEAAAAAAPEAAAVPEAPQPLPPSRQLPAPAIVTPQPADTSYVRAVPAQYPPVEPIPIQRQLPAPAPAIVTPQPADVSAVTAVPAQYPEVEPGFTRPPATPGTTSTPWPGTPAAPGLSFDELARSLTGKSPAKLTAAERASVQGIYDRITQGVTPEPPPSPRIMPQAQAAQAFPEAYPQPKPAPAATPPVPAPAPPPVTPEPPAAAPAPPASASSAAQALYDELKRSGTLEPEPASAEKPAFEQRARDVKVDKLYDLITSKKVPQEWVARFTPESWRILAHEVGVPEPSAATIRQIKARLANYYRPRTLPATTPAEAQAAFDAARARVQ